MSGYDPAAYGKAWSAQYDDLYAGRDDPAAVVAALERLTQGRSLLDIGIGTGRLAIPLHDAGWRVAGIEASDAMISRLRERAGERDIAVHAGDMRSRRIDDRFDVALIAFSTLFLLPDQDSQVACLQNAVDHLGPGGVLVVEAFIPDHARWSDGRRVALSRWADDGVEIEAARHDRARQTIEVRYLSLTDAGVGVRPLALRYAWPSEIDLMVRLAGAELTERWADWQGSPYGATSQAHVSVYRPSGTST
jgi:SAM-dependent methyltransferase